MAPTSHGIPGPQGRDGVADGSFQNHPPPSTLAAQLVENISASTRSSRPDETAELKRFFGVIEQVKNQPELLSTYEERVDHNHMLIYVYARVVLEGLKWDDLFSDKAQLQADASRALSFLKVTIKETPEVLLVSSADSSFIFRGEEPLWLWIMPKVLKMLGHSQCCDLTTNIESFFHDIYQIVYDTGSLWPLIPQLSSYFRDGFNGKHWSNENR